MLTYAESIKLGKPTDTLHVGFPSLRRYDLLQKSIDHLLAGSRPPDSILVVDNGGGFVTSSREVTIIRPGYNLGVATSWNLIQDYYGNEDVVIMNDDIIVGRRTLEWFTRVPGWFLTAYSYGCFLRRKACRDLVGRFDEFLWPMYWEDCDYDLRMIRQIDDTYGPEVEVPPSVGKNYGGILGIEHLPDCACHHAEGGSRSKTEWMGPWIGRVQDRFLRKWGALNRIEAPNKVPFNGKPDAPFSDYLAECYGIEGYVPYMDQIIEVSQGCETAVEVLADVGRWSMCFLAARVKNIHSYAWQHSPEWDYIPRVAQLTQSKLKLISGYNPFDEIPETDILFINEDADEVTKRSFASQHNRVRKCIAFLGEHDLVCPARDKFREELPSDWEQSYHLNGLTMFLRKP